MIQTYKRKLAALALLLTGSMWGAMEGHAQACSDLFFSEYTEATTGSSKAIEIFNPTSAPISLTGYTIKLYANGAATATGTVALTGTIAAGDVYVIANTGSVATLLAATDLQNNTIANWNGDDAIALTKMVGTNEVFVDIFGNIGCDPGTDWNNGTTTKTTINRTLRRKSTVTSGITTDPAGTTATTPNNTDCPFPTLGAEWDDFIDTDYSNFGSHTANCGSSTAPTLNFATATSTVAENVTGGTLNIPVSITNPSATTATTVTVAVATAGGTATSGTDYTITTGTLTFPAAGTTDQNAVLTITDDAIFEGAETINLILSSPSTGAVIGSASTHTVTITDNETAPTISFGTPTTATVAENAGVINVPVVLSGASSAAVTVEVALATAQGTATAGSDYTFTSPATVTIPAGSTTANATITIIDDAAVESTETIALILQNAGTGAALGTTNQTYGISITDNDVATANPVISFQAPTSTVAENVSGGTFTIPVTIASPSATNPTTVTIAVSATPGTATAGTDYTLTTTSVTFPAGSSANQNVTITLTDDNIFEGNETLSITLSNPTNNATLGATSTHTVTITDNDVAPVITFGTPVAVTVQENAGTVNVPVTISNPSSTPVTVQVALATPAGTATAASDFTFATQTLTFAANSTTTQNATVTIINDKLIEAKETILLTLQTPTVGTIGTTNNAYTITIVSDDAVPLYTVAQVTTNNPTTFVADSLNKKVSVRGTLYGVNQRATGLQLELIDATGGIDLFRNTYPTTPSTAFPIPAPVEGDSVQAWGTISQFNGLTELNLDSIKVLGTNHLLRRPKVLSGPQNETHESELVKTALPVTLVTPSQWKTTGASFNVDVTDGTNTYQVRILTTSNIFGTPAPTGPFYLTATGGQNDTSSPYDAAYQLIPRRLTDIQIVSGLKEELASAMAIYPNPASDVLHVTLGNSAQKVTSLTIVNALGQEVATFPATTTEMNISNLSAGVYFVKISTTNSVATKRFVKVN